MQDIFNNVWPGKARKVEWLKNLGSFTLLEYVKQYKVKQFLNFQDLFRFIFSYFIHNL